MTFSFPLPVPSTLNQGSDIYSATFVCVLAKHGSKQTFDNSVQQNAEDQNE